MRYRIFILAALAALAAHAVQMASQPWVTNRIAEAVAAIPAARADLTPATNYTDAAVSSATNNLRAKTDMAVYGLQSIWTCESISPPVFAFGGAEVTAYPNTWTNGVGARLAWGGGMWMLWPDDGGPSPGLITWGELDAQTIVFEDDGSPSPIMSFTRSAVVAPSDDRLATTGGVAVAVASAVPAGVVVTNEYGGLEGLSSVLINGFVQADTAIIYGYVTAQGVESHGNVTISDGASLTVNGTNVMDAIESKPTANAVKSIVTETTVTGYTDWTFSGDTVPGVIYSVRDEEPTTPGSYIFTLLTNGIDAASVESSIFKPLTLTFTVGSGSITASREPITVNKLGLARLTDLADFVTHTELSTTLANMDTSYTRTIGLTNKNQTVQYVAMPRAQTELNIVLPTDGATKDWLVYVFPANDVTLRLPTATYWGTDAKVLDAMPSNTVTALYFSQVTDGVYSIGRQTLQTLDITNNTAPTEGN